MELFHVKDPGEEAARDFSNHPRAMGNGPRRLKTWGSYGIEQGYPTSLVAAKSDHSSNFSLEPFPGEEAARVSGL